MNFIKVRGYWNERNQTEIDIYVRLEHIVFIDSWHVATEQRIVCRAVELSPEELIQFTKTIANVVPTKETT